jgi:hypothetical protein
MRRLIKGFTLIIKKDKGVNSAVGDKEKDEEEAGEGHYEFSSNRTAEEIAGLAHEGLGLGLNG